MERPDFNFFYGYRYLLLGTIFLAGFLLALFPINQGYHYWDETVYLQHGEIISGVSDNNFNEFQIRPPLFSVFLGLIFIINHGLTAAHVAVAAVSAIGILLTYLLGKELFNVQSGIFAAGVYAFSPLRLSLAGDIMVDSLLPVLWIATIFTYYKAINLDAERQRSLFHLFAGVLAGLSVLMKFTSLIILPVTGLILLIYKLYRNYDLAKVIKDTIFDRDNYLMALGFLFTILPYLLWSKITYGTFISTFIYAWLDRGLTDPFMTYLNSLDLLIVPLFFGGLIYYVTNRESYSKFNHVVPLLVISAFYGLMQFLIRNREPRFLLPIIPFISIAASRGFDLMVENEKKLYTLLFLSLIMFSPFIVDESGRNPFIHGTEFSERNPPVADAALWMKNNTPQDAILYTNFQEPQLGYYSKREIRWIAEYQPLNELLENYITESGYVYYSNSTRFPHPSYKELNEHPDFTHTKSFNGLSHIFYYNSSKQ